MKKIFFLAFLITCSLYFSQRIKCEQTDYLKYNNKEYSTYHYVESDNSMRSLQIFIINNGSFDKISSTIPQIFKDKPKQDFTDIYILGISDFDKNNISQTDREIITNYINDIKKYRKFYMLSPVDNDDFTFKNIVKYINDVDELCLNLICKKSK